MWLVIQQRQPRPDVPVWPGRKALAALDAVAFPAAWIVAIAKAPFDIGLLGAAVSAIVILVAIGRLARAIFKNERYRFSAWRWGRLLVVLLVLAVILKLSMQLSSMRL